MYEMYPDEKTVKLHLDNEGFVWGCRGAELPADSKQHVLDFVTFVKTYVTDRVRIIGTKWNAQLITAMYAKKLKGRLGSLEVGSPVMCTKAQHSDPVRAILAMRMPQASASLGGWHEVERADFHSYALVSHLKTQPNDYTEENDEYPLRLLKNHPMWIPLSYIPTIEPYAVCRLLAEIIDPRWYVDVLHPGRCSRLNTFLGCTPQSAGLSVGPELEGVSPAEFLKLDGLASNHARYQLVKRCWQKYKPGKEELKRPENFLWRTRVLMGSHPKAELRTCQLFVAFLHHAWLDALYVGRQNDPLFIPEYFFKHAAEIKTYKEHAAALRRVES